MPLQHKLISWWMLSHPDDMKKKIRLAVFDVLTESLDPVAKCPASSPSESSKRMSVDAQAIAASDSSGALKIDNKLAGTTDSGEEETDDSIADENCGKWEPSSRPKKISRRT